MGASTDTKHTPGPLKVFTAKKDATLYIGVGDADGGGVLDTGFGVWRDGPEALANAKRIVHTWNCHDDLVEALEIAMEWINGWDSAFCDDPEWIDTDAPKIRAALAKARGES